MPRSLFAVLFLLAACVETPADEKLEEAVRASFHEHTALLTDHLNIHCENGVVYVSGLVATYLEFTEVERVARTVPGVKQVVNMTAIESQRN